jgi:hypothetical protein
MRIPCNQAVSSKWIVPNLHGLPRLCDRSQGWSLRGAELTGSVFSGISSKRNRSHEYVNQRETREEVCGDGNISCFIASAGDSFCVLRGTL